MPVLPATTIHTITVLPESFTTVTPLQPVPCQPGSDTQNDVLEPENVPVAASASASVPVSPVTVHCAPATGTALSQSSQPVPIDVASHLVPRPPSQSSPSPTCPLGLAHSHHYAGTYTTRQPKDGSSPVPLVPLSTFLHLTPRTSFLSTSIFPLQDHQGTGDRASLRWLLTYRRHRNRCYLTNRHSFAINLTATTLFASQYSVGSKEKHNSTITPVQFQSSQAHCYGKSACA